MIKTEWVSLLTLLTRQDSTAISYICNIAHVMDNENHYGAGSTFVCEDPGYWIVYFCHESTLCFLKTIYDGLFRVCREARLLYHKEMQAIPQKVSALTPSMAIIDAKVATSRPLFRVDISPALGWQQISNNGNPIFIVISDQALIRIGGIPTNNTGPLIRGLSRIVIGYNNFMSWLYIHHFVILG